MAVSARTFGRAILAAGLLASLSFASATAQVQVHTDTADVAVKVMSWRDIPFRTVVRQQHDFSCGSAALATLLTYQYGRPTSEPDAFTAMYAVGDQQKIQKVGFSLLDMKNFLDNHGYLANGYRLTLDDIAKKGQPVIALIDLGAYRHFVVIKGVAGDQVLVGDPALGLKIYKAAEFKKIWNGVALALYDTPNLKTGAFNLVSDWQPWSRAPTGTILPSGVMEMNLIAPTLYQIVPVHVISNITGSQ
jgi:predicted double-glycine peptidase